MSAKCIIAGAKVYVSQDIDAEKYCEKGFDRPVDMQEIGLGLLNSQFGTFIKVWLRYLGLMRLLDGGLAGPLLMSFEPRCRREWQTADKTADFGWLKAYNHLHRGSVTGVTPRVSQSLLHLIL